MEKKVKQRDLIEKSEHYQEVCLYPMGVLMMLAFVTLALPGLGGSTVAKGMAIDALLALGWCGFCHLQASRALRQVNRLAENDE